MNSITIFCGSSFGSSDNFRFQAMALGEHLAKENITLVYGGAKVGLMGAVADGALSENGKVIGVLPEFLMKKEVAHEGLTELILVDTMLERKTKMNDLCDGVIALPGGFGTLDELFEMLTWGQLGLHKKPIGILNIDGFYDDLIRLLDNMVDKQLLKQANRDLLLVHNNIGDLITLMRDFKAPDVKKWISRKTT